MSRDALFQLGMGSVLLNASQKEETLGMRAIEACAEAAFSDSRIRRSSLAAFTAADLFRAALKSRGNSAKALIATPEAAGTPLES